MPELTMPRLSDSMEAGVILEWLVTDGDEVSVGADLVEIETDKATMVFQSEFAGTVLISVGAGETVDVGAQIGSVLAPGESAPAPAPAPAAVSVETATAPGAAATSVGETSDNGSHALNRRIAASPIARRIAAALDIDLGQLVGSGPAGRVVKRDVMAAAHVARGSAATGGELDNGAAAGELPALRPEPSSAVAPRPGSRGDVSRSEPSRLQATVARRMLEAKSSMPEFTLETVVDMTAATALRAEMKALEPSVTPSFNDFVVRAAALALRAHPWANGAWRDGGFEHYSRVNVGVAVAAPGALVVPTVFDADRCSLGEIARETRRLAAAGRDGKLSAAELEGGTFSISNLGMYGISRFTAVLNPPQAAILAVGAVEHIPVVRGGAVVPGSRMAITLTCDHRILYGADAAAFVGEIRTNLEAPLRLAL